MRVPITLSERAIRDAKAFMANPDPADAVEALVVSYGNLVAEIRGLRSRVRDLDDEAAVVDALVEKLRSLAVLIEQL